MNWKKDLRKSQKLGQRHKKGENMEMKDMKSRMRKSNIHIIGVSKAEKRRKKGKRQYLRFKA